MSEKSKFYVYSMLASSVQYNLYDKPRADGIAPAIKGSVLVKGGAGVADKNFLTATGAVISGPFTGEEIELLKQDATFKLHEANGFVQVSDEKLDNEVAAAVMAGRDASAPTVAADFEAQGVKAPVVNNDAASSDASDVKMATTTKKR